MANLCKAFIPFKDIEKMEIYINKSPWKTVAQIKAATGADYIINGTLYNMSTGEAVCNLKANGKVYCAPPYQVEGYAWDQGSDFKMVLLPNLTISADIPQKNYIACTNLIIGGKPIANPCNDPARQGTRGRTAIGIKGDCLALYCAKNGTSAARNPVKLRDDLYADGWDSAVMLDGGNSAQCDFLGETVTSSRKVPHLILVYLKPSAKPAEKCPYSEPTKNVKMNTSGTSAKWVQWHLNKIDKAGLVVDGIFGKLSVAALKKFQANNGLVADGICGKLTRAKMKELIK